MHPDRSSREDFNLRLSRNIGDAVRQARKAANLTQEQAAEHVGISPEFYARIERGVALPGMRTLYRLATGLGISGDVLLGAFVGPEDRPDDDISPQLRRLIRRLRRLRPDAIAVIHMVLDDLAECQASATEPE